MLCSSSRFLFYTVRTQLYTHAQLMLVLFSLALPTWKQCIFVSVMSQPSEQTAAPFGLLLGVYVRCISQGRSGRSGRPGTCRTNVAAQKKKKKKKKKKKDEYEYREVHDMHGYIYVMHVVLAGTMVGRAR